MQPELATIMEFLNLSNPSPTRNPSGHKPRTGVHDREGLTTFFDIKPFVIMKKCSLSRDRDPLP